MNEHEPRIGILGPDRIQREQMFGAFHDPAPARRLVLQMLQETTVELVGRRVAGPVHPVPVGRDLVGRVEAQAAEDMRGDLAALLW